MSSHNTESVTGLLDGELKGLQLRLAKQHVGACPICAAEYRQQQHLRRMLQANPPAIAMDDSAEFFWSKVKSDIQRRGDEPVEAPLPKLALADWLRQQQLALASLATLAIAICGAVWFLQAGPRTPVVTTSANPSTGFAQVDQLKTPVPHSAATAFDSEDAGATVIWTTGLPWTRDMNEMKTRFAHLDT